MKNSFINLKQKIMTCDSKRLTEKIPEVQPKLEQYYNDLIERCPSYGMDKMVHQLKQVDKLDKKIQADVTRIIGKTSAIPELAKELQTIMEPEEFNAFLEPLINACRPSLIIELIEIIRQNEITKKALEKEIDKLEPIIIECCTGFSKERLEKEEIYDFVRTILKEIAENEDKNLLDIKEVGSGEFSKGYQIGEKVIKFGECRIKEKIPYHRRILQPILRRPVYNKDKTAQLFYIEISEAVENSNEIEITEEDVYQVYKELREDEIIWIDAKPNNLGRLKKTNIVHMKEVSQVEDISVRNRSTQRRKRNIIRRRIGYFRY